MYSQVIYLQADQFAPEAKMLDWKEEFLPGKKVHQKKLAEQAFLAALLYLQEHGYLRLKMKEGKFLFINTSTSMVERLKDDPKGVQGLEAAILSVLAPEMKVNDLASAVIGHEVLNPWGDVLDIIKRELVDSGLATIEEGKKILGVIGTKKFVLKSDAPQARAKDLEKVKAAFEKFTQNKALSEKVSKDINLGISMQESRSDGGD